MATFCGYCGESQDAVQSICICGKNIGHSASIHPIGVVQIVSRVIGVAILLSGIAMTISVLSAYRVAKAPLGPSVSLPQQSGGQSSTNNSAALNKFIGRWFLVYSKGEHPIAEDGTPILYEYAEIFPDGKITMHKVFADGDFPNSGEFSNLTNARFHFSYSNWDSDFGVSFTGDKMSWQPANGEAWLFVKCSKRNCSDKAHKD